MAPAAIGSSRRDTLRERRGENLQILGMQSMVHSEPMVRVMDDTRPIERTRPAAAKALDANEAAVSQAVSLVQGELGELEAWRAVTVSSYVPQLMEKLSEG